jgi:hypothetical protein
MNPLDFVAAVREAAPEELPGLLGKLAEAEAMIRIRLNAPSDQILHGDPAENIRCLSPAK